MKRLPSKRKFFIALAAYPTHRQRSNVQFLTAQLYGTWKSVIVRPDFLACSPSGATIEMRRNAAPSGTGTGRYWKIVSEARNFFPASYQHPVICHVPPRIPW